MADRGQTPREPLPPKSEQEVSRHLYGVRRLVKVSRREEEPAAKDGEEVDTRELPGVPWRRPGATGEE
ncbi:MAG TPA: hypothetical protein VHX88_14945 [Solirubrobacteraceae bacterium]|jgi:hypothetical protein|nr:hypothetical protein [Solirubrobacteraceae bacterium]